MPDVQAVAVDSDPRQREMAASIGIPTYASLADVPVVTAAIICTPASDHVTSALNALERGCDVLIEKPLAPSLADAVPLRDAAERSGRIVAVGYNLRFDSALRRFREALVQRVNGRPLLARVEFGQYLPDWRPTRDYRETVSARREAGGGILLEASHEIDLIGWLFGSWRAVTAVSRRVSDLEVDTEDTVIAVIEFEEGPLVELHLDFVRRGYHRSVVCDGSDGRLEWHLKGGARSIATSGGERELAPPGEINDMYVDELRAFLAAVRGDAKPIADLADGLAALELIEAIRQASAEASTVRR